jgi:hypothetical protein
MTGKTKVKFESIGAVKKIYVFNSMGTQWIVTTAFCNFWKSSARNTRRNRNKNRTIGWATRHLTWRLLCQRKCYLHRSKECTERKLPTSGNKGLTHVLTPMAIPGFYHSQNRINRISHVHPLPRHIRRGMYRLPDPMPGMRRSVDYGRSTHLQHVRSSKKQRIPFPFVEKHGGCR